MLKIPPKISANISPFKFLLLTRLARNQKNISTRGYTLIELLVAMIIAVIVITPILGLAVNLLQTDRQEQAKATSEEEIQLAADFIARDLKQAVYIYDADALEDPSTTDANTSGIQNQIPPGSGAINNCDATNCKPVLVFWKRKPFKDILPRDPVTKCDDPQTEKPNCDDTFVFSLVAYYLISNNDATGLAWSNTARIARFEIVDGVVAPTSATSTVNVSVGSTTIQYMKVGSTEYKPSDGFQMFDLSLSGTLEGKMNRWTKTGTGYQTQYMQILLDYADQTPVNSLPTALQAPLTCPTGWSLTPKTVPTNFANSFAACVNNQTTSAIVYLRGNAIARIESESNPPTYTDNRGRAGYFPSIKTEVQSVGRLVQ